MEPNLESLLNSMDRTSQRIEEDRERARKLSDEFRNKINTEIKTNSDNIKEKI